MTQKSLNKILKESKQISTDIGVFNYIKSIGEGGNSFVFLFEKSGIEFAIKFLKNTDSKKLKRFKDEYFCAIQIPTNKNIVNMYHFDSVNIPDDKYYIIVMKYYSGSFSTNNHVALENDENKAEKGWKLCKDLMSALNHLHKNKIIHRDIKPQNIFYDNSSNDYVLGDLGIAHFVDEFFPKESETKSSEKLANFAFSAPEQINSDSLVKETCDIYSLGQVLQWYLSGKTIRGLGRTSIADINSPEKLKWLDSIVSKCLNNEPEKRFLNINDIQNHIKELKSPPEFDYLKPLDTLDDVIRRTFPQIDKVFSTTEKTKIKAFIDNFQNSCEPDHFWAMNMEGGDNPYKNMREINSDMWLFWNFYEVNIDKLFIYRDGYHPYKNFFVLLLSPSTPFDLMNPDGTALEREVSTEYQEDYAVLWENQYIEINEIKNGYFSVNDEVISVDQKSFRERGRYLQKYAYIIVPVGTATSSMTDRTPTERFLQSIVKNESINEESLKAYLSETVRHHSPEITKWN